MDELMMRFGATASLMLAFAVGSLVTALLAAMAMRQQRLAQRSGEGRLRKALLAARVQLDHARKDAQALQMEVQGWRHRSAMWQEGRHAAAPRAVAPLHNPPPASADAWVLGVEFDESPRRGRADSQRDFADTQIEPAYAH